MGLFAGFDEIFALAGKKQLPSGDQIVDPDARYLTMFSNDKIPGLHIGTSGYPDKVGAFSLSNYGSPTVNPRGSREPTSASYRKYNFRFYDQAREDMHIDIQDRPMQGRDSHTSMNTQVFILPRVTVPSIKMVDNNQKYRVTLPTGEHITFDVKTREILDGVLAEQVIDYNSNRHARKNPQVSYTGKGLSIKISQRGSSPRQDTVWGKTKQAEISYPSKYSEPCFVKPGLFWDQTPKPGDTDPSLKSLAIESDAKAFAAIESHCGWDLSELKTNFSVTKDDDVDCIDCLNKMDSDSDSIFSPFKKLFK